MKLDNIRKTVYIFGLTMCLLLLSGCGSLQDIDKSSISDNVSQMVGSVQLYHTSKNGVEPDEERYQLKQPDNLSAALEEIIEVMTFDEGVSIERFLIDENKGVTLYIRFEDNVSQESRLLSEAAIVRSVEELDTQSVGVILIDEAGNELETATFTDSSFYYYED